MAPPPAAATIQPKMLGQKRTGRVGREMLHDYHPHWRFAMAMRAANDIRSYIIFGQTGEAMSGGDRGMKNIC